MFYFFYIFSLFIIYSCGGWLIETIFTGIIDKKLVNRGFLLGPYCPIYGIGGLLATFILWNHTDSLILMLCNVMVMGAVVEYITSYVMEKLFHARWWDYSQLPFNLNGRICLSNCILFAIMGTILVLYINPFLYTCLSSCPKQLLYSLSILLFLLFLIDCIISFHIVQELKLNIEAIKQDYTGELNIKIKEALAQKSWSFRRILKAFPDIQFIPRKIKKIISKQSTKIKNSAKRIVKK